MGKAIEIVGVPTHFVTAISIFYLCNIYTVLSLQNWPYFSSLSNLLCVSQLQLRKGNYKIMTQPVSRNHDQFSWETLVSMLINKR